jgi:hypothetical protein
LGEACAKTGWRIHGYCLLTDHFHLLLTTPEPNLVEGMKWFLGTYTARFNRRHDTCGHLFSGRYKSQLIDPAMAGAAGLAADYIHLNPVRCGLVGPGELLSGYPWSSFPAYLQPSELRPGWLEVAPVFADAGFRDDALGREAFRERSELQRHADAGAEAICAPWRTGWFVGGDAFRDRLLAHLQASGPGPTGGPVWRASVEQQAERVIARELASRGWSESDLSRRLKTDPDKVFIAREIRKETTLPLTWIASRLQMGSRNTLRNALAVAPGAKPTVRPKVGSRPVLEPLPAQTSSAGVESLQVDPGWD